MRHYELVTILSPMLNQDDASATWDEIKSFITNRDGEITAEQTWGTRRLAYPIRKGNYNFLEGSYYLSSFTSDNSFNRELENYLRLHDNVLRSLVVRCDGPLAERPAPGPLTAPSRYIPPGRGRRNDGGGPIPEAAGGFAERGPARTPDAAPPAPAAAPVGAATAEPAPSPSGAPPAPSPSPEAPAETPPAAEPAPPTTEPTPAPAPTAEVAAVAPEPEPAAETPATAPEPEPAPETAPAPAEEPTDESTA